MVNRVIDFPEDIHNALLELARECRIKLRKETHYEARDRELRWYIKNSIYRLNFDFSTKDSFVSVTYLIDKFPIPIPQLFEWGHDYIPYFPYCAKITWKRLDDLSLGLTKEEYKKKIKEILAKITINKINHKQPLSEFLG